MVLPPSNAVVMRLKYEPLGILYNSPKKQISSTLPSLNVPLFCILRDPLNRQTTSTLPLVEHTPDLVSQTSHSDIFSPSPVVYRHDATKPEMPSGVDQQPSPGPSYMGSSPASFDYVEEQLKATVRDVGIVKDASARRQAYQNTSNDVQLSIGPFHHVVQDGASTSTSDTSSLTLNVAYSRHNSPFPPLQGPAQLQDLFYGPMDQQSPWMQQNPSGDFGMMQPDTFTAGLLGDQALGMAGAGDKSLTQPNLAPLPSHTLFIFPPVHLVSLSCLADVRWIQQANPSSGLMQNSPFTLHPAPYVPPQDHAHPIPATNIIPPTPLKDGGGKTPGASASTDNALLASTRDPSPKLDLGHYSSGHHLPRSVP
ncbi:hypothetical protein DFJ58DRAFT_730694 [Suillus subalutaceus]|uniref:uncharacterized protein n=1 Tax=Suillus subalutaceus TaxID=48586 RepID=UPI001B886853|nr:uncharacterized protein DFJ58DRAFT_730694 [Suillus subalutaceus]KAG1845857.1 hypothetical protein DFJ58DRAFT_730694 [Suillus subalutaceus]